ncbi:hypothetical protein [Aureispira anguillae]|uniref:Uncharacterized protein n=1 Tax=Aureispira anguillae TaxID=2864201 RepID=A0A916DU51_9BACT|nr:hypothetical protein [Aureispira anguillae]BDS12387.1 hypothetical protein AsAng_0031080 [Aureispira anguillae]
MACDDPDAPLFFACHLEGEGTVSEDRNKSNTNTTTTTNTTTNTNNGGSSDKNPQNVGNIINAGANGLDSITGFINSLTGKSTTPSTTYITNPNPPKPKVSPWLIGGAIGGVVLLITLLIVLKNGQSNQ